MSILKKLSDLDFYLLNTKNPKKEEIPLVEAAFKLWQNSWEDEFKNLRGDNKLRKLYADDFLAREALALFSEGEAVALIFISDFWLRPSQINHSYFKNYPIHVIEKFLEIGIEKCLVLSYLTCKPEWRKKYTDFPISEVLFSLGVKVFQSSNSNYLISSVRKIGVTDIFLRHGATSLHQGRMHNMDVDFMLVGKNEVKLSVMSGVAEMANHLWNKMEARSRRMKIAA